ncbi:MAG: 16S rRNA (uracil(1498)-N(3))-methyltransferase [Proteobacteria bacterium]|nr:16S rRNA (uracil(1498)-N(3))-methyltransferase [Pseudomonadota bacterium]
MSAPRFYVPRDDASVWAAGHSVALPESASHHALRVLRLAAGDPLTLFDGRGGEWRATVAAADRRALVATLAHFDPVEREIGVDVTLVQAIIATDPMDLVVRKAVELGVARVVPLVAARTQGTLRGEKAERRLAHWRQIVVAACEQCGRNRIPEVADIVAFDAWVSTAPPTARLLAPGASQSLAASLDARPTTLVVGPEGGWTDAELAQAARRGIARVALGPAILRAETAAIAALAVLASGSDPI